MSNDEKKLHEVLSQLYENRRGEIRISPSWLATEAMAQLDSAKRSPDLIYRAAHLAMRQIARSICRKKFEDDGQEAEQSDLFPNLQTRYPAATTTEGDPEYVLLQHLTERDVNFNVRRLRREGQAKLHHADALDAWWKERKTTAAISEELADA